MRLGHHSYTGANFDTREFFPDSLDIGNYCSIADNITVFAGGEYDTSRISTFPFSTKLSWGEGSDDATKGKIVIGNDVWIGSRVIILSGVTIGNGACIGAGAVVARDIPPYAIAYGVPAKVGRYRFSPDIIERLQKCAWWDWPDGKVKEYVHLLCGTDIEAFLEAARC